MNHILHLTFNYLAIFCGSIEIVARNFYDE